MVLFIDFPEIEMIVGHRDRLGCTHSLDILNDRRTERQFNIYPEVNQCGATYRRVLFPEPSIKSSGRQ